MVLALSASTRRGIQTGMHRCSNPDLKSFAAEAYRIVLRHLGELGATTH